MAVIQYESDVSVRGRVLIYGGLPHQFLKADGSLDSNTYALASSVHNPVTLGTANGLSLSTQQLSLGLASNGVTGALSGTDWNTFNGKFNTPTGLTTNYLPKWNGSGFGNSIVRELPKSIGIGTTPFTWGGNSNSLRIGTFSSFSEQSSGATNLMFGAYENGVNTFAYTTTGDSPSMYSLISGNHVWSNAVAGTAGNTFSFVNRMALNARGALLINKTDDDLTNQLQVAGTISASPATTANQVVVMSQINGKANADGSNVSGTWGINISGNASSATNWGGRTANLDVIDNNVVHLLQRGNDGVTRLAEASGVRTWLGLGSNAYTSTPYLPLIGGTLTGNLVVASTATSSLNLGSVSSSWAGIISYPTIFGSTPDRWIMHINPHISYTAPGVNGFSGTMTGSTIRFAGNPAAATSWDIGVGTNGVGEDKFSIGRLVANFLNITNSGTVQVSNIFDVMGASYLYGGLSVGTSGSRVGALANANSIAIGDYDTGFRQNGDGVLETYANGALVRTDTSQSSTFSVPIVGTLNGSASFLPTKYDGGDKPNPQSYFTEYTGLRVAMTRVSYLGTWSDTLWINGYSGGDVPNMVAVHTIRNGQPRMWLSSQSNRATDYGTPYEVITDYNASSKVLRKGNDTNGGTYQLHSTNTSGSYWTRALEIREVNLSNADIAAPAYAPAIGFHWSGLAQTKLMLRNDGQLAVSQNATDWGNPLIHSGNIGQQSVSFAQSANSANTVGGISTDRIVYGGVRASNNDNNLNNPNQKSGFYYTYGGVGAPTADWGNWITVAGSDWYTSNNYEFQLWHAFHSDDFYVRKMVSGSPDSWRRVIDSGNIGSQSVNYANSAGSAPNANNQNSSYLVTPGDGNGIKFWASDSYKISMGVGSLYQYGPVTDYSIKMQMNADSPGRGFTWGREGITPIAALNATSGNFQTTGNMAASAFFQFSDIRLKTVIPHQHVSVENITPITYLWKDPKKRASPQVGYSAQEVQKVMPYAVSVADDGMLSVNYIQVLVAKVAELELKLKKHGLE